MTEGRAVPATHWGAAGAVVRAQADLAEQLIDAASVEDAAQRAAEIVAHHRAADVAAVTTHTRRGAPLRLGASDADVLRLDARCPRTMPTPRDNPLGPGELILVEATTVEGRWTDWGLVAADVGLRSALLVGLPPLPTGPTMLELYSRRPRAFPAAATAFAVHVAQHAGLLLRHVDRAVNLAAALHSRGVVGQAQGILMERYGLTGEQAMAYLRRHSQDSQVKLHDIAGQLVAGREVESRGEHDVPEA